MEKQFDPNKDEANIRKHGVSLALAFEMDLETALVAEDRRPYGEQRFIALGPIGDVLFVLAFTYRDDDIRPISLRPAEKSEKRQYRLSQTR